MTNRPGDETEPTVLTDFQVEVARLFFSLPASDRFLLAGGAALLAQHMTVRPTHDLDFFTGTPGSVQSARDELEAAAQERG
ncbi:MAG TPA: nucleotidyl transferase AbiEii/AbiGii toxin family protein [Candidatus Nanopelagicales bacterium]